MKNRIVDKFSFESFTVSLYCLLFLVCVLGINREVFAQQGSIPLYFHEVLENSPDVLSAKSRLASASERGQQARDIYYPTLSITGSYGLERTERTTKQSDGTDSDPVESDLTPQNFGVELRESIFRGGVDVARVAVQDAVIEGSVLELENTRQDVLLQMIAAYVNVQRYEQLLGLARLSTDNIQYQAELESTRIERGRGYNTDLLQAKAQLAEAVARKVRAERGLAQSVNVYRRLFDSLPELTNADAIVVPEVALPDKLDMAVERAISNSWIIKRAKNDIELAEKTLDEASGLRWGALDLVGGVRTRDGLDGSDSNIFNYYGKLEYSLTSSIPSFGSHAIRAADLELEARVKDAVSAQREVLLQVRQAWSDFESAVEISSLETDRADIAEEFLNLARRERELNRRSLLEVLSGETNLYAARIQAISANADAVISAYSLLRSMGLLRVGGIVTAAQERDQS